MVVVFPGPKVSVMEYELDPPVRAYCGNKHDIFQRCQLNSLQIGKNFDLT